MCAVAYVLNAHRNVQALRIKRKQEEEELGIKREPPARSFGNENKHASAGMQMLANRRGRSLKEMTRALEVRTAWQPCADSEPDEISQ